MYVLVRKVSDTDCMNGHSKKDEKAMACADDAYLYVHAHAIPSSLPLARMICMLTPTTQEVLGDYVRQYLPRIHAHFVRHQFDLAFASTSWLLCIFINSLPMSAVMHVVDLLLFDGSAIIVRACLGLLSILQQRILECDSQEDILTMMKPKGGYLTASGDGTDIDGQLLMKVTFLNFPQLKDIDSKRAHHRASRNIAAMEPAPFKPASPATS